jgi:pimeloyl-ACP methyl ester carboxylesterase
MMSLTTSARDSYGGSIPQGDSPPFVVEELPGKISLLVVGSGPPLVLFPGLSRDARQLTAQIAARRARAYRGLARVTGRTVYLVNRPRDLPPKLTMPDLATAHADALRSRFAEPVDIMGVSTGGAIALQLAVDHPMVVRRLIVACAASSLGDWGRQQLALYGSLIGQGKSGARVLAPILARSLFRWPMILAIWLDEWLERNLDPADMLATIHAECGFDVTNRLAEITAPTLVIGGENDGAFSPDQFRATAQGIPGAQLVLYPRRGHISAMFDPRFGRDVAKFLQGNDNFVSLRPE